MHYSDPEQRTRERATFLEHKDAAARYADGATRGFYRCTCGWNNGDHEDRCALMVAWWDKYEMRLMELEDEVADNEPDDAADIVEADEPERPRSRHSAVSCSHSLRECVGCEVARKESERRETRS